MSERCPKCGTELVPNPSYPGVFDCPKCDEGFQLCTTIKRGSLSSRIRPDVEAAPWVCKEVAELERQLDAAKTEVYTLKTIPYAQELEAKVAELQSELDAALAQVGMFHERLEGHECSYKDGDGICEDCKLLARTSATAQQFVARIERKVREAVWSAVKDMWGASPMQFRAAILGEKEKP
ncbi:MAG: hypothetical protein JSS77_16165 [Acidobacteria bacterium]|nr:hypothetical protein [Acidobacteriota bacterium]